MSGVRTVGELRAPLVGLFKGRLDYGPLPIELALFADAGVAWTGSQKASFLGGDRSLLTSETVTVDREENIPPPTGWRRGPGGDDTDF